VPPIDELGEVLAEACTEVGVPGAVVGVLVDGEATVVSHGVTNVEHPAPVEPCTVFQVGSISKTFASAAVMLLVQEGRVRLEDPIARHLPDLGPATGLDTETITVEMALSHQAGFDGDHLFVTGTNELTALADARRLFPPGKGFSYSNAGFSIAGAVVEAVSGEPFDAFVRARLLRPLGIVGAGFRADEVLTGSVAIPHWVWEGDAHVLRGGGWQPRWELGSIDWAAAGLVASADHLLEWARFQWTGTATDGTDLLSTESLARLHTPVVDGEPLAAVGLDWYVREVDGVTTIGHGGLTVGYVSDLKVAPDRHFAFVGLTNATNGAVVNHRMRRWAFAHLAGLDLQDPVPDPALTATVDTARLAGRYVHSYFELTVEPGADAGTVRITPSARTDLTGWQPPVESPVTCGFFTPDDAVEVDPDPGPPTVVRFPAGTEPAAWIQWSGRMAPRLPTP
jgi:CubicO group peptidase (beta-lactamase class C family)